MIEILLTIIFCALLFTVVGLASVVLKHTFLNSEAVKKNERLTQTVHETISVSLPEIQRLHELLNRVETRLYEKEQHEALADTREIRAKLHALNDVIITQDAEYVLNSRYEK